MKSLWFPPLFALLQTVRHVALIAYDYWTAAHTEKRFSIYEFVHRDLARPLFEPSGFCDAWTSYGTGQTAVFGLDFPAYVAASLLHSAVNWRSACLDTFTAPRGQIIVAMFVLPLWFVVGLSIRRVSERRWRRRTMGRLSRGLVSLGLIPVPFALLGLLLSIVVVFVSGDGKAIRLAGIACWTLYVAAFAAERLRVWPFDFDRRSVRPEKIVL